MSEGPAAAIREHAPFIWRTLRHLGVPEWQLEDLSQDVCIVIVTKIAEFQSRSQLRTWIYGICRNVAKNAARQRAHTRVSASAEPPELPVAEQQTQALARSRALAVLHSVLQTLPEPARMVFVMFEIESLPMEEVAATLSCTPSTAYSRLYTARARVYAALEQAGLIEPGETLAKVVR